jgi:hypothetical protein
MTSLPLAWWDLGQLLTPSQTPVDCWCFQHPPWPPLGAGTVGFKKRMLLVPREQFGVAYPY